MAKKKPTTKTTKKAPAKKKAAPKVEEPVAVAEEAVEKKPKPKAKPKAASKAKPGSFKKGAKVKYSPRNQTGTVLFSNSRGVVVDFGEKTHYCRYEDLEVT